MNKPLRIVSDGTGLGTKVYDADGHEIKGYITKVEWSIEADGAGQATLTFANVEVDLIGETDSGETKPD